MYKITILPSHLNFVNSKMRGKIEKKGQKGSQVCSLNNNR